MSTSFIQTEGIILRVTPYGDYHQILIIFTPDTGIIHLFLKGYGSKKKQPSQRFSPLSVIEFTYKPSESNFYYPVEIHLKQSNIGLRESLERLQAACELLKIIEISQLPEKPAPDLYIFLKVFLKHLSNCPYPDTIVATFLLKILIHEGLLSIPFLCSFCGNDIENHANDCMEIINWDPEELLTLYTLATTQQLSNLLTVFVSSELKQKTYQYFQQLIT